MFQNVRIILLSVCLLCMLASNAQPRNQALSEPPSASKPILPGAEQIDKYMPLLKGKKIAVFANHTSVVGKSHLVDTLQKLGVDIKVIFAPEHGFRGTADAGEKIGEKKTINIPAEDAYGSASADKMIEFPREQFPPDMTPEVGMQLSLRSQDGHDFPVVIAEVREEVVVLDANHPLAGKDLVFDVEVVGIG